MKGTTPPFENSEDTHTAAERSVEKMRSAFGILVKGAQRAVVAFDQRMRAGDASPQDDGKRADEVGAQDSGQEAGATATSPAARDASSMLELAQKLAEAGDVQDLLRMQAVFVQAWMQILGEQARALAPAAGAIVEAVRNDMGGYPTEIDFAKAKQEAAFSTPAGPGDHLDGSPNAREAQGFARAAIDRDIGLELDTIAALLDIASIAVDEARASAASTIEDLVRQ